VVLEALEPFGKGSADGMPGLSLFHMRPRNLEGRVLYPLGELESLLPQVAARARQKYVGREWLPTTIVPGLGCRWMDVVFFIPVHPEQVRDALLDAGHPYRPRQWIQIDAQQLGGDRTAVFLPGDSPAEDVFAPFDVELLASHCQLSAAQRAEYARGAPGEVLLFGRTAHVLHRGCVAIDESRILTV
jgi:hypothetical protein